MKAKNQKTIKILLLGTLIFGMGGFLLSFKPVLATTGINKQINFQGKVVNTDGTNVSTASYNFLFCIYTTASPTTPCTSGADNDAVWRESKSLTVTDGIFQTNLGDTTALPGSVDFNTDNIYLGVNFNSNGQMTPLVRFTAAPYAMNADKVGGLGTSDLIVKAATANQTVTSTQTSGTVFGITDTTAISAATKGLSITLSGTGAFDQTGLEFNLSGASGTNLNDIVGSGSTWKVSRGGAATLASVASSGAIAANGGITFDQTSDTIGSFTAGGTILMNTNILQDIGNTGTDFIASTGALTLAGVLTANGGISLAGSQSLSAAALSFVDLGSITHSTTANQGLRLPNAASATPSNPTSGEGYLAWDAAGNQLITYNGAAWTTVGGGSGANTALSNLASVAINTDLIGAVAGGMGIRGGSAANDDLILEGTTNATRTTSYVILQPNGGNVGIGTASPAAMLDVFGTANMLRLSYDASNYATLASDNTGNLVVNNSSATQNVVLIGDGSATDSSVQFDGNVNDYYIGQDDTDDFLHIGTGSVVGTNAYITLDSTGKVGIGDTTPDAKLDVDSIQTSGTLFGILDSTTITGAIIGQSITLSGTGAFDQTGLEFNLSGASGTNLNDIVGSGSTWKVSKGGAATLASVASSGAIAANGGITFDQTSDTIGSFTAGGTILMNSNILQDIGNTGTDFIASTGALTLAGVLTANGGATIAAAQNLSMTSGTGTFTQTYAASSDATADAHTITLSAGGTGSTGVLRGLVITQADTATTGVFDSLALIENNKTPETTTNGLLISNAAGTMSNGIQITNAGTLTAAITIAGTAPGSFILDTGSIDISGAGAITGATGVSSTTGTFSSAIAANGGITFDQTSDTIGSFTAGGTILMNTNILQDIGNTGTDFIASTGALTLAGVLTANGGISLAGSQSLSAAALSFVDLGSITHSTTANQGLRLPNAASATPSNPTSGEGYLAWDAAGNQLITYNGAAWTTVGGGGYATVQEEGTSVTQRSTLNFIGSAITCIDNVSKTECTIAGGVGGEDLQTTYGLDADGSNATISLTSADDSLVFTNPTSAGTDSAFLLQLSQQNTTANVLALDIVQSSNAANGVNLTANSIDGETGLAITTNGLTSGKGISVTSSVASNFTGNIADISLTGSGASNTGNVLAVSNTGSANTGNAISITNAGTGNGLLINATGTGSLAKMQLNGSDKVTFANSGSLTINGENSSIVRNTSAEFALGTIGSNLTNSNSRIQLADGVPANSGQGAITTASQPATPSNIGAGAFSITRPNGKYLIVNGGATNTTQLYDPFAGTITASQTITCNGTTTVGIGSIALPRADGLYTLVCGVAGSTTTATSTVDPSGIIGSRIGPALATAVTGAGTVAYKRPDGKYLITIGASTPGSATNIYDPVADTFVAGPAGASGTWTTGALALPMPDGRALIVNGGSTSVTNIYNPNGVSATIGTFTVGPSLDGVKAANTCGINGAGSIALKRQDGKYVILSKASVYAVFDPSAMTITCNSGVSNVSALGDGAHAIPIQNGKFLIFAGGNTTTVFVYNQDSDTFSTYTGTTPTAITTGAHSILRPDGSWQVITGTNTCTNGCTNNFSTNLPMSDPFPIAATAGAPSAGGACDAGFHSYYVTFITNGVESELGQKSNIVSCTASNGTVALSGISVGPSGTTARKIYRTTAGDSGLPKLLNTTGSCSTAGGGNGITDNTTTTCSDTTADASLGSTYSVTAATTWYTSEDISNTSLSIASTIRWTAQLEAVYAAMRNNVTNTAYRTVQIFVKTAINSSGCANPLAAAPWQEIQSSGDAIRTFPGANCAKIAVHFNRAMPKKLYDDRGTWTGNSTTVLRYDYTTPALFDVAIDNSAVLKRSTFDFVDVTSSNAMAATVPTAPTSSAPSGSGSCTSGNHYWFVTFVINGVESNLSPASTVQSCSGSNNEVFGSGAIPTGPSGTTARKIYRTAAGFVATDTPFLVGTISDNSTTTYTDGLADASLGAAYSQLTPSGPVLSRAEGSRVETTNNQLTLPWGRITPTSAATLAAGVGLSYMGRFGSDHPTLNNTAGPGTFVIARDDKTFLVVEGGGATADLYDPATQTFTNQTATGDKPTATVGLGAFAIKRPNGKFLVVLGNNSTATNIYDQYAPPGSRFTAGPALTGTAAHQGAFAIQNADGTWTILPGNAATTTSLYDPVRNTMTVGPLQTTGTNYGALAIPLQGPNANIYKVIIGTTLAGSPGTATMNYNANTKMFTAGQALAVGVGNGAMAFQRQDGYWVLLKGESAANTLGGAVGLINPYNGTEVAGTTLAALVLGRGSTVIPRADGTFLITSGNSLAATTTPGSSVLTAIYFPWGGAANTVSVGTPVLGTSAAGPAMAFQGTQNTAVAAPTTSAPASGGANLCDTGTHLWRYTQVINGVETALSLAGTVQTCTVTTAGQESLTAVAVGPTGTTARKVYRTKAGTTSPYFLVTTIADNSTTTYADSASDASLGAAYWSGGPGDGAVSFQRPDGKFITIYGGASWTTPLTEPGSNMVSIYDAGWFADGQYLSEAMNVPAMAANSTLEWQQTPDQFVRMAVRTAASQTALGVASYTPISNPGGSIGNAASDTWAQVQVNFRRDFPTFGYNQTGVYVSSGMVYTYRNIPIPTVNSFQITNGMDLMSLQNNGLNVFRVTSNGSILSSSQGGFFSGGADLAENYTSTQALDKGEVVMIDQANPEAVLRATGQYQNNIIGVVSTKPGFVAGGYTDNSYPIALVGRVPVRVSTENGPIQAGDTLTSASIPGYAMKATMAGRALGRALETFDPAEAVACPSQGMGNFPETKCGSIMMFVNLANYYGSPVDIVMADKQIIGEKDAGLNTVTTEQENGGLFSPSSIRLAISPPTKKEEMLDFLKQLRDERLANGISSSEVLADRIAATGEIISPTIITDTIFAKHIKADSIEGLQIFTDQIGSLSEKYARLEAAADTSTADKINTPTDVKQKALAIAMKDLATDTITVQLDGSILGKLSVAGALRIGGDAQFDGNTVFSKLASFLGDTLFKGKVVFDKSPTFGNNTAGFAIIAEGQKSVDIVFDEEYAKQPIVSVTITNDQNPLLDGADKDLKNDIAAVENDFNTAYFNSDIKYIVTKKSEKGFTIVLNKSAPRELQFSWVAIAVKNAKITHSQEDTPVEVPVTDPIPMITPPKEIPVQTPVDNSLTTDQTSPANISPTTEAVPLTAIPPEVVASPTTSASDPTP
jgi:hypothetical protein